MDAFKHVNNDVVIFSTPAGNIIAEPMDSTKKRWLIIGTMGAYLGTFTANTGERAIKMCIKKLEDEGETP